MKKEQINDVDVSMTITMTTSQWRSVVYSLKKVNHPPEFLKALVKTLRKYEKLITKKK
jgi:hypothetical protein